MLTLNGKEVMHGLSRKQIEDRGGHNLLIQARETLVPNTHKKQQGFALKDRAVFKE